MNATATPEADRLRRATIARPPQRAKVLCVDDQPANLLALEATLTDLDLDLVKAHSGRDALRCLLKDVKMPDLDGLQTAEIIRQRERCQHTPIIFLTAFERDDLRMFHGYALGAVDYLHKPIVPQVLRSKVAVFVDLHRKAEQIRQQAELLRLLGQQEHERQLAEARERWEMERLREEIRLAWQVQQKLFPPAPLPLGGFDISGASYPAEATGGDYFDYVPMQGGRLGLVIGDVSGHGLGPALLMAELRAYLRAFLLTRTDVGEILGLLNRALAEDAPEGQFATLLLARLDLASRSVVYASAGHTPGYLLGLDGAVKAVLPATGMPLAVVPEGDFAASSAQPLEPGDCLLLLTDGIVEAHGPAGNLFGIDRVLDVVRTHRGQPAREIVDTLYGAVRTFCGTGVQLDDMTAILVRAG
jgi:sigma-B regulation protein RsbU (phosphoserine phosphatase)